MADHEQRAVDRRHAAFKTEDKQFQFRLRIAEEIYTLRHPGAPIPDAVQEFIQILRKGV